MYSRTTCVREGREKRLGRKEGDVKVRSNNYLAVASTAPPKFKERARDASPSLLPHCTKSFCKIIYLSFRFSSSKLHVFAGQKKRGGREVKRKKWKRRVQGKEGWKIGEG